MTATSEKQSPKQRGDQTRRQLLDAAERLFSARGVAAVSLREIRIAAGARNKAAIEFHFGGRDGLIDALIDRHMPRIAARQSELYAEAAARRDGDDSRPLVDVLIRPGAEYLTHGESERAWVKIMSDLGSDPSLQATDIHAYAPEAARRAGATLYDQLVKVIPPDVALERLVVLSQAAVHMCADRARLEGNPATSRRHVSTQTFVRNLVDMIHGALFAPAETQATEETRT